MKKPGSSGWAGSRSALIACISFLGLGILANNAGGTGGSAAAAVLLVLGSMFGLVYLRGERR